MRGIRFALVAAAVVRRNLFNTALGYPRPGIRADGTPAPPGVGVTLRCAAIRQHPTLARFALQESDEMQALEGGAVDIGAGLREVLDDLEWFPPGAPPEQ